MVARRSDQNKNSRYVQGGESESLQNRIGWWERRIFQKGLDDVTIILNARYSKRPDVLAFDVYNQASLMWFVLQYNTIVDINTEFIEGREIRLPPLRRIQSELTNAPKRV